MTNAIPVKAVQVPTAAPRSSASSWVAVSTASDAGTSSAPATPCSARAATRIGAVGATAHSSEVTANHATPSMSACLRPRTSA